jgi:methylmalonyl-CoA mutase N-terminal domain/subunit
MEPKREWEERHRKQLESGWKSDFRSSSGYLIQPVYASEDLEQRGFREEADLGLPGEAPFTRGITPGGYRTQLWQTEMYAGFGSAEDANARYRMLLEQGSTGGVSIALDLPTQVGLDSDHELASYEVGRAGVAIDSLADVEDIFKGIPLRDVGHVFTTANSIGPIACAWFFCLAERSGISVDDFQLQLQNDPIKEYVARGTQIIPMAPAIKLAGDVIEFCADAAPSWLPISVSGSHMKQAGGTPTQEAAFTLANAIAYTDELVNRGMRADDAVKRYELHFCTDMDFYEEIAKYRAVRRCWSDILEQRFGVTDPEAFTYRLHAATSGLPLTAQQPLNNIARITLQVLAQVMGGVAATRTASFDEALAIPTEGAATTSLRINQVIAYESGIPYTVDPWGGSYFMESLTADMVDGIRRYLEEVDNLGGTVAAIEAGYFQRHIDESAHGQERAMATGERVVVGVNRFKSSDAADVPTFHLDPATADRQRQRLHSLRESRNHGAVQRALASVEDAVSSRKNVMPSVIEAVRAYATVGEICDVFRHAYGTYTAPARSM